MRGNILDSKDRNTEVSARYHFHIRLCASDPRGNGVPMLALLSIQFGKSHLQFPIVSWCLLGMNNENNHRQLCKFEEMSGRKDEYVVSKRRLSGLVIPAKS